METTTMEAPNALANAMQSYEKSGLRIETSNLQQQQPPPEAPKEPVATEQTATPEPKAKTGKSALDKLSQPDADKGTVAKEEAKPSALDLPDDAPKEGRHWKQLKEELKAERQAKSEYETKVRDYEKQLEELTKSQMTDKDRERLDRLSRVHAVADLQSREEYQREVVQPFKDAESILQQAGQAFKVPVSQLFEAIQETNPFERAKKIKAALAEGEFESDDDIRAAQGVIEQTAKDMHGIWQKDAKFHAEAEEIAKGAKGLDSIKEAEAQKAKVAEYAAAKKEVRSILESKMPFIFSNEEARAAVEAAEDDDSPMQRAYRALIGEAAPFLVEEVNRLTKELAAERAGKVARSAASPKVTPTAAPEANGNPRPDFMTAMREHKQSGHA